MNVLQLSVEVQSSIHLAWESQVSKLIHCNFELFDKTILGFTLY